MRKYLLTIIVVLLIIQAKAGTVSGIITDIDNQPLPYASVSVKNSKNGTTANSAGAYSISLQPGSYTLIAQFVGYKKLEKTIKVEQGETKLNFVLTIQELTLEDVVVTGKDPANEIIKNAIKKRNYYNEQVDSFSVQVYIKGLMRSAGMPSKFLGKKIEIDSTEGLDSTNKGILFLSESVTKVDFARPDKIKYNVISSRESGGGYGLSFPFFINFYQNNVVLLTNNINPRGFVSPIADAAFTFYNYKFKGSFMEGNKLISNIEVTPKRKNEPLFTGILQIIEDDWRIYSTDLLVTNQSGLEMLDTLKVIQQHGLVEGDIWKTQNQIIYLVLKQFGFHINGNFVNVYSDYDINPGFDKKHFGRTLMKYDTAFNKKDTSYWSLTRPVALEADEKRNFEFKDSILLNDTSRKSPEQLRALRKPYKFSVKKVFWSGDRFTFHGKSQNVTWSLKPLLKQLEYNTVEGLAVSVRQRFSFNKYNGKNRVSLDWDTRYGTSNTHLNSFGVLTFEPKQYPYLQRYIKLSGGKRLSQFNKENPISPLMNALYTLFLKENYAKYYENWFGQIEANKKFENGFAVNLSATYENRLPLENSEDFSFFNKHRTLLPNHPYELAPTSFNKHQAVVAGVRFTYQPGQRYIEYPDRRQPIGSDKPVLSLMYQKGIANILGSDVNFDKWQFSVSDKINLKLAGEFRYKLAAGGFLNDKSVAIPDLQHFNGNQTFFNGNYLNSFQIAPYYRYSNAEPFYLLGHAEHHFNGLLTNKIPLFNKLKWHLVGGSNAFFVNKDNYYIEAFAGLENIFKVLRVDFVNAYQPGIGNSFGVRLGFGGLLGDAMRVNFGN